jgi:hypothetical protein
VLHWLLVGGVIAGVTMTVPLPEAWAKGHDRASATLESALHSRREAAVCIGHHQQQKRRSGGSTEKTMITETQTRVIVLHLTDELLAQLQRASH